MLTLSRLQAVKAMSGQFGIFTRTSSFAAPSLTLAIRGPKKAKGGKGGSKVEASNAIINIFKDGEDPVIYPSDAYPPYVMQQLREDYSPDDVVLQMMRGERIPEASEQWSLAKAVRRLVIKDAQKARRAMWEYESEDDEGEDLGDVDERDLDDEAGGEVGEDEDEGAPAKKAPAKATEGSGDKAGDKTGEKGGDKGGDKEEKAEKGKK